MSEIENNGHENAQTLEISPVEATTRAEFDIQVATANRFPRNLARVKAELVGSATMDEETAAACFYRLPRGGKAIEGPSVRLAEIAVGCYKNLRVATRITSIDANGAAPHVVVQAVCFDLQANTSVTVEKRRRIVGKLKNKGKPDEDDINLAANNASSIAFRDAVFKVVPLALVKPALDAAKKVARGEAKPLADRIAAAVAAYLKIGVSKEQLLAKFGYSAETQITEDDLDTLRGLITALREGEVSLNDEFPPIAGAPTTGAKPAADKKPGRNNREASDLGLGGKPAADAAKAETPAPPFGDEGKEGA